LHSSFIGWAPGRAIIESPSWAGVPIGRNASIVAFAVNVHFDNRQEVEGFVARDGMRISYTPTLRSDVISSFSTTVSRNDEMIIPAGKKRYFMTKTCKLRVQSRRTREPAIAHIFGVGYHAHLLGREMYSELTPVHDSKTSIDIGSAPIWHFDDQGMKNVLNSNFTLQTGDTLQTSCIFDSTSRANDTVMNSETTDEMCWAGFHTWPGDTRVSCQGPIWLGELDEGESGFGLAMRHPVRNATYIFDGRSAVTGGERHESLEEALGCKDNSRGSYICPTIVATLQKSGLSEPCDMYLVDLPVAGRNSRLQEEMFGANTALDMCCTLSCEVLCPSNPRCPVLATAPTALMTTSMMVESQSTAPDAATNSTTASVLAESQHRSSQSAASSPTTSVMVVGEGPASHAAHTLEARIIFASALLAFLRM